jgi:hypothetical protein
MNLLGCLVRLFAWMPSWVSLGARSWSTGESTPSAPPLAERERRRRVREKTPQPSPTSPSAAALVRRGRNVHFASTDASAPPGSPPYEGGRERVRGGGGGSRLPRRRLAPNQSLPPLSPPEPAAATASPPPWVARRLQRAARVCGCPNGEVRRGGADRGWGRNGDEIGAVVAKTWPSDATEMDGREGVRYFHAVGRPVPSITEINIFQNTWWVNLITVQI